MRAGVEERERIVDAGVDVEDQRLGVLGHGANLPRVLCGRLDIVAGARPKVKPQNPAAPCRPAQQQEDSDDGEAERKADPHPYRAERSQETQRQADRRADRPIAEKRDRRRATRNRARRAACWRASPGSRRRSGTSRRRRSRVIAIATAVWFSGASTSRKARSGDAAQRASSPRTEAAKTRVRPKADQPARRARPRRPRHKHVRPERSRPVRGRAGP